MAMTTTNGHGAPIANEPHELPLYAPKPPVARINRRTVMGAGILAAALAVVVLVLGFSDHRGQRLAGEDRENSQRPNGTLDATRDLPKDYSFDVRQAAANVTYELPALSAAGAPPASAPAATRASGPNAEELAAIAERQRLAELRRQLLEQQRKEMEQALDSPLLFANAKPTKLTATPSAPHDGDNSNTTTPSSVGEVSGTPPMLAAYGPPVADPNALIPPNIRENLQREKEEFLTKGAQVEPYLKKPLIPSVSPYELKAGTVIPGALVTAINTDLPGEIIGQVTENVYDSTSGKYLLVPQGAKLLGRYSSLISNGQNRALIVWTRLILPDGKSIVLDGMPGTDGRGQAGIKDNVDYHVGQLAGAVGLTTAIAYAGNLARSPSERNGGGNGNSNSDVIGDTVAQQANRIGEKYIDRELDVQPTITVRAGWKFNVLVNKDMILSVYEDSDVTRLANPARP